MVSDGTGIIVHHIHQAHFHITFEQRIVRRALREITTIKKQQIRVALTFFFQHGYSANKASSPCLQSISKVLTQWHNTAMRVIGMQNSKRFLSKYRNRYSQQSRNNQ